MTSPLQCTVSFVKYC